MHNMSFDSQIVRDWVYQTLRKPMNPNTPQMDTLFSEVGNLACQAKAIEPRLLGPNFPARIEITDIPAELQNMIRAVGL